MARYGIAAGNHIKMKKRLSTVLITLSKTSPAVFLAYVYFFVVTAPPASRRAGIVPGLAGLAAGHERVGRDLKVLLLRKIDSVIMGSCKECTGN